MSFFEDIAAALDENGIESRVNDDVMFVPINSDVDIQLVEIDPILPAANVYIAAADVDEDDENFEATLVGVVFSVEDAVAMVAEHVATDQVVTVLEDLVEGTDERIGDLEFYEDDSTSHLVRADVGENSELQVFVEVIGGVPTAIVHFVTLGIDYDEVIDEAIDELWESDGDAELTEEDRQRLFNDLQDEVGDEVMQLGIFTDFDRLFDVLSLAADQAEDWENQLAPLDDDFDGDTYEIFTRSGGGNLDIDGVDELDDPDGDGDEDFDDLDEGDLQ